MSTWILIGDSQAVGLSRFLADQLSAHGYEWVGRVANVGWSTSTTARSGLVPRLRRADLAIVVLGGNDSPTPRLSGKIARLIGQIRASRIVWVGPAYSSRAEIDANKRAVAQIQRGLASELGYDWLDGRSMTLDLQLAPDGLHFVRSAREAWAARIVERLEPSITPARGFLSATLATIGGALLGFGTMYWIRSYS